MMTVRENIARLFPLHYQRICELAIAKQALDKPSQGRWNDLAGLFDFGTTEEDFWYWWALAFGAGVR